MTYFVAKSVIVKGAYQEAMYDDAPDIASKTTPFEKIIEDGYKIWFDKDGVMEGTDKEIDVFSVSMHEGNIIYSTKLKDIKDSLVLITEENKALVSEMDELSEEIKTVSKELESLDSLLWDISNHIEDYHGDIEGYKRFYEIFHRIQKKKSYLAELNAKYNKLFSKI